MKVLIKMSAQNVKCNLDQKQKCLNFVWKDNIQTIYICIRTIYSYIDIITELSF